MGEAFSGAEAKRAGTTSATDKLTFVSGVLRVCDGLSVLVAGLFAYWLRHRSLDVPERYLTALAVGAVLAMNYLHMARLYTPAAARHPASGIGPLTAAWSAAIATLVLLGYLTKTSGEFSRVWATTWFALTYAGFIVARLALELQLQQWESAGRLTTNVAIVGGGGAAERIAGRLAELPQRYRIVGVFDDDAARLAGTRGEVGVRGSVDALLELARRKHVDDIVLALPWQSEEDLLKLLRRLRALSLNVRLGPDAMALPRLPTRGFGTLAGLPVLNLHERPLAGWGLFIKAIEDRLIAGLILIVAFPPMLLVAAAIKLDSTGPALFRQRRYGFNNDVFTVFKFRTMRANAGAAPTGILAQATRGDPRVTRVGTFLRRTSLDELPQLLNVLKGDMSLVGPRPHAVAHNEKYGAIIDDYLSRHRVKPGITGWAQVNGLRGETDTPEKMRARVEADLYYIDHWSLLFDLRILFLTLIYGFVHKNAY